MSLKPDWKQLKADCQRLIPDWKTLLHKGLPYALAVILASATFLSVLGVRSTNAEYVSLQGARNELESEKQILDASQEELETVLDETKTLLNQLIALNADVQALLEKAETEGSAVTDKIEDLQNALENAENKEQQRWQLPMKYVRCSSPYGNREHPVEGESKFHYGVDLAADKGTPIVASRSGTVEIATYDNSSGYYVGIDHLDGYKSYYMHLDKYIVTTGQFVLAGQIIGYCGDSGTATGNHLHFGIYYNGSAVNPADYIDMY